MIAASLPPRVVHAQAAPKPASVTLTNGERALLARGEISETRHVLGSVFAFVPGLGLGHVVQGRWLKRGWIFTVGKATAVALIMIASSESDLNENLTGAMGIVGFGGFVGLHVWEVVDAIVAPRRHNRRVRELRVRAGRSMSDVGIPVQPFMTPPPQGIGAIAGMQVRF